MKPSLGLGNLLYSLNYSFYKRLKYIAAIHEEKLRPHEQYQAITQIDGPRLASNRNSQAHS